MSKIKYGIIGFGWAGRVHARVLNKFKDKVTLQAVCDTNCLRLEEAFKEFGIRKFLDYRLLLNSGIDAVSICTPNYLHSEMILNALNRGIHVICEKPLCIKQEEIEKIKKEKRNSQSLFEYILHHRFEPINQELKKAIENNELGEIISGSIIVKWRKDSSYYIGENSWRGKKETAGSGVLMTQAIHAIDLMQWFLGDVKKVYGKCLSILPTIEVEDNAMALLEYKNGAIGLLDCSTSLNPNFGTSIQIVGREYSVILHDGRIVKWGGLSKAEVRVRNKEIIQLESETIKKKYFGYGHIFQIHNFINAISGKGVPKISIDEAERSLKIIWAILESSIIDKEILL